MPRAAGLYHDPSVRSNFLFALALDISCQKWSASTAMSDHIFRPNRRAVMAGLAAAACQWPDQAARAQADYDCWILDSNVASLATAAQACRTART